MDLAEERSQMNSRLSFLSYISCREVARIARGTFMGVNPATDPNVCAV